LEQIEMRTNDASRGNLFVRSLNVVKNACLIIELLNKVKRRFGFMDRRVDETCARILKIAVDYMAEVTTEEEMRFLLLEKDLDSRDALNMIYDNNLIDLLINPFAQNIVTQIWGSSYNNSDSLAAVSSNHNLLVNYNHCRYDLEQQLRFYNAKDLDKVGCHNYQFQVWRNSGQTRYQISAICNWLFIFFFHLHTTAHLSQSIYIIKNADAITYAFEVGSDPESYADTLSGN
jgi:hypothetical protein